MWEADVQHMMPGGLNMSTLQPADCPGAEELLEQLCGHLPPEVALLMAQAASFLMSNSASLSMATMGGMSSASITAWICSFVPAAL
jgi:hypothetical protein